jgi:PAS domain S-box-containing protein
VRTRTREEFDLREQLELLDRAIAHITQGLCMYGPDARLIICNPRFLEMYGLDPTNIRPGLSLREIVSHRKETGSFVGDVDRHCDAVLAEMAAGRRMDRLMETGDGREIRMVHQPMQGGGWVTTHEDVTERRRAEAAVRASREVLENTFEHMDQGVSIFDGGLRLVAANRRFREIFGMPESLCRPGTPLTDLARFNAERGVYGPGDIETLVRERQARARAPIDIMERTRTDGTIIEIRTSPLPDGGFVKIYTDISQRIRAERELQAAHARLRDAFEVVPEGLVLFDAEDRFVLWNRRYSELYPESIPDVRVGVRFEDVLRGSVARGQHPDAKGHEEEWLATRLARHRETESAHEQALPNDRWVRVQERRTADGGSVGIRVDITDLKRREDTFKLLFESNPVPMFVFDIDTFGFLAVNDALLRHYGYTREQSMKMSILDIRPPEDREAFAARIRTVGTQKRAVTTRHLTADGRIIDVEVYSTVMSYEGRDARFAAVIDITDRLRAEAERDRSRAFLDRIIDTVPISITVKDARDLTWILINHATEDFIGLSREQVIGKTATDILPPDFAALIDRHDHELIASAPGEVLVDQVEVTTARGQRTVATRRLAIRDADGTARFLIGTQEDITDRKAMENQLQQAQKMEAVGKLTGGLAHDFNNLLTVIIGNLELLQDEVADKSQRAKLDVILLAADRGASLTQQMLAFSRRQALQPKRVDGNRLIERTVQLLGRTLGEAIHIEQHLAADVWPIFVDEAQLESALVNIAINARDAMPDGGTLRIESRNGHFDDAYVASHPETHRGDYAVIEITDTGTGMPPEVRERIFEPFFTTKPPGQGSGLGLSMVYGFMKQSGGHITVYSEPGRGTSFKLYLPRAIVPGEVAGKAVTPEPIVASARKVVLAVDDNPSVRATVVANLTDLGYRVLEADGPATALAHLDGPEPIDLLFTDVVMPGGTNGKQLATLARGKRPGLRVLFTSGFPGTFLSGEFEIEGGDRLLSKPYRKHDLARAVAEALE